jgi:hypothetical protein
MHFCGVRLKGFASQLEFNVRMHDQSLTPRVSGRKCSFDDEHADQASYFSPPVLEIGFANRHAYTVDYMQCRITQNCTELFLWKAARPGVIG